MPSTRPTDADLRQKLRTIDGRSYKGYEILEGTYQFPRFSLAVDHVQSDPFATPSRLRVRVSQSVARFPPDLYSTPVRRIALQDFIARRFDGAIKRLVQGSRGIGHSGLIAVDAGGQEIIERNCCVVDEHAVEVRFVAGLPAAARTILGREAEAMLGEELPRVVEAAMVNLGPDREAIRHQVLVAEDQAALREALAERRLIAFVADGSILPRASGGSDLPLRGEDVVEFASPPELRVEIRTPNRGPVAGMGVPPGVTLIVGGGFHGKSTLLSAIARGVYDHIPGDGREYVVTRPDAVKIRAEDGRSVQRVNISPFIGDLPFGKDTTAFTSDNASGSTSQAANIAEALEAGARTLLIDEDTSATNFMIRDARMQRLIPKSQEPITPFIDQVRNLHGDYSVSTVLVMGGSGDYFDVADTIIAMRDYRPAVVTTAAQQIARDLPTRRNRESRDRFGAVTKRAVVIESLHPEVRGEPRAGARGLHTAEFGGTTIHLSAVEQIVDASQTRAIADILLHTWRRGYFGDDAPLAEALARSLSDVERQGLDILSPSRDYAPDYALPRLAEVAAALNRLRGLEVKQVGG